MLKALHGDCFVMNCNKDGNNGIVVVDGGPHQDSYKIVKEIEMFNTIDLMVVTHFDDDHIGGILAYIDKHRNDRPFPVREMWINCAHQVPVKASSNISYGQAKRLSELLSSINEGLAKEGYPMIKWEEPVLSGQKIHRPYADFDILSPTLNSYDVNMDNFEAECSNISSAHNRQKAALSKTLKQLSELKKRDVNLKSKQEVINLSSIAFIMKCDSFDSLMLGDSYPAIIEASLKSLGYNDSDNKLCIDYMKVSHHGSAINISNELLDMIDCRNYLISTNGGKGRSCHPDRETIGNITWHSRRNHDSTLNLIFNYPVSTIETVGYKFLKEGEECIDESNFKIQQNIEQLPLSVL